MRNTKNIIVRLMGLLLTAVLMFPSVAGAQSKNNEYRGMLPIAMGIADKELYESNNSATRIQFVDMVLNMLEAQQITVPENAQKLFFDIETDSISYQSVYTAYMYGIVKGGSDGFFRPDAPITLEEATVILLRALNAECLLSQSQNSMQIAAKLKLFDKVNADKGILNYRAATQMIYNALTAPLVEAGKAGEYFLNYQGSIMGSVYEMRKATGILERNYIGSIYNDSQTNYGIITVGGVDYTVENADYNRLYLGYKVDVYYSEKSTEGLKAVYIDTSHTDTVTFETESVDYYAADKIHHYNELTKKYREYQLSSGAITLVNDKRVVMGEDYAIPENGIFTLLDYDNDNIYDAVKIDEYSIKMASSVNSDDEIIYFEKESNPIDLKDYDAYFIIDQNGNSISLKDIKQYSVLEIYDTEDKERLTVYVINDRRTLTVSGTYDNTTFDYKVIIDSQGTEYRCAPCFEEKIELGMTYEFAFDSMGRIAAVSSYSADNQYTIGYVVAADFKQKIGRTALIKFYTVDGVFITCEIPDKVKIVNDDSYMSVEDAVKKLPGQLVRYKADENNVVKKIELPSDDMSYPGFRKMATAGSGSSMASRYYSRTMLIGFKFAVNSSSTVMMVPSEENRNDESCYKITNSSFLMNQQYYPYATGYKVGDANLYADVCVIPNLNADVNKDSDTMVVEKIDTAQDESGIFRTRVTGYVYGKEIQMFISDESLINYTLADGSTVKLEVGDVISYGKNFAGEICLYTLRYDCSEKKMYAKGSTEVYGDSNTIHYMGQIAKRRQQYLEFIFDGENSSNGDWFACTTDTGIYYVKEEAGKKVVSPITYNDIATLEMDSSLTETFFTYINSVTLRVLVIYEN